MRNEHRTLPERFRERLVAFTHPHSPRRFERHVWLIVCGLVLLLLLPTLFFPLGHDEAMFFLGGRMILDGGVHYRDIVDIKPPLIYHIYALAILLFGPQASSIRILDLLLQLATSLLLCQTIRKASGNDLWGGLAAIFYALSYVGLSYSGTAHTESYTGLAGIAVFYLLLFRTSPASRIAVGALIGSLFLLKLTLGIFLGVAFLAELTLFDQQWSRAIRNMLMESVGFLIPLSLALVYLVAFDAVDDFAMMQSFTSGYSGVQWKRPSTVVIRAIDQLPQYLANQYSLVLLAMTLLGSAASFVSIEKDAGSNTRRLLRLAVMALLLLLFSIAIEAKYAPYQFSRIYAFGIVLGAYGAVRLLRWLSRQRLDRAYLWIAIPTAAILLLFFSPLTRYLRHAGSAIAYSIGGDRAIDVYYGGGEHGYTRGEMLDIGDYLSAHRHHGEQIYIFSAHAGMLYQLLDEVPRHKVFHMAFVVAPFAPLEWKESTARHILTTRPEWIALQTNDSIPDLIERSTTSLQGIMELPGVAPVLKSEYREVFVTPHFVLLYREG